MFNYLFLKTLTGWSRVTEPGVKMSNKKSQKLDRPSLDRVAKLFSAFSDGTRLAIIQELMEGPQTVGELVIRVGGSQGNVSKQLQFQTEGRIRKLKAQTTQDKGQQERKYAQPRSNLEGGEEETQAQNG